MAELLSPLTPRSRRVSLVLMAQKGKAYCSQPGFWYWNIFGFLSLIARIQRLITFIAKEYKTKYPPVS